MLLVLTAGEAEMRGSLSARGGSASQPGVGGEGGRIDVRAARIRFDAAADLSAGNAVDSVGGNGGVATFYSYERDARVGHAFTLSGGTGTTPGRAGLVVVDGVVR